MNPAHKPASDHPSIVAVDFKKRPHLKLIKNSGGIYKLDGVEGFFVRPTYQGKRIQRKLKALNLTHAKEEWADLRVKLAKFHTGFGADPINDTAQKTVAELCTFYEKQGCPRRKGPPAPGKQLKEEIARLAWLKKWGAHKPAQEITLEDCTRYRQWRVKHVAAGKRRGKGGDRTVDLELTTLSNVFRCAMRNVSKTGIKFNPIGQERERFRKREHVEHCRDFMPRNADELHALARYKFDGDPFGEVIGWAILFQAMIGHRINELLKLRMDARNKNEPGYIEKGKLYLHRSTSHKGAFGHIEIFPELRALLDAHQIWHKMRFPEGNPWFFPSPRIKGQPIDVGAVTHSLKTAAPACGQGKRTSHGLRAYRVNVLRSQGKPDDLIALLIGQKTRGDLIVQVYGEGLDYKIGYLPENIAPAWEKFLPTEQRVGPEAEQKDLL